MRISTISSLRVRCAFLFLILTASFKPVFSQTINFGLDTLQFKGFTKPEKGTSLKFGPDGRLYMAELNGQIKVYSIQKSSTDKYSVTKVETLLNVQKIPNHDDIGTLAKDGRSNRQCTGLTVVGTPNNPIIYVTSSDPKWGGPSGDKALDTNSGIITKLTWTGSSWDVIDLVRGLPRSEENHSTNGIEYTIIKGKPYLLVASGGNTNAGSPSKNFAYIVEYALSAAILSIDLNAIEGLSTKTDSQSGRKYKYDIPTLDDPSRPNANGIYNPNQSGYNGIDVGDPFGGNDGLNMAMVVPGGPVQIFSSGYRNTYDLVVTENGKVYVTENGANSNWGGMPEFEGNASKVTTKFLTYEPGNNETNPSSSGEYVSNVDHLMMITSDVNNYQFGSYYGGHPNPIRANPGNTYVKGTSFPFSPGGAGLYTRSIGDDADWSKLIPLYTPNEVFRTQILSPIAPGQSGFDDYAKNSLPANWPPVPKSMANLNEADYRAPNLTNPNGPQKKIVTLFPINTNGIAEYKASYFNGAMKGALIAGKSGGYIHLILLNSDGSLKQLQSNKWNLNAGNVLGITSNGDAEIFPGTIWATTYDNRIHVLTPQGSTSCIAQNNSNFDPNADYDNDGFTNKDEIDNVTDYCSAASKPNDFDGDFISDLNDLDDDGDGTPDSLDPFQLGIPSDLPIYNDLFSDQIGVLGRGIGYLGLGFTGLMNNGSGKPNWLNWLDIPDGGPLPNDILGGAAGAVQIAMTGGTANGTANNQHKGFQFGVNVGTGTGEFLITGRVLALTGPQLFYNITHNGEIGIQMSDGTQSNFFKLVFTKSEIMAGLEVNNIPDPNPLKYSISTSNRPTSSESIDFILKVKPVQGTVEPIVKIGNRPLISLGTKNLTGKVLEGVQQLSKPLAIGVFGTSGAEGVEFLATYDFFNVTNGEPNIIQTLPDISKQIGSAPMVIDLSNYFEGIPGGTLVYTVSKKSSNVVGTSISGKNLTLNFPSQPGTSIITIRATDSNSLFSEQTFEVNVVASQQILFRINSGGIELAGINGAPNWEKNDGNGSFNGDGFTFNYGKSYTTNLLYSNRHSSIPSYIDKNTFESIFRNARFGTESSNMEYNIPMPSGTYEINLYMGNSTSSSSTAGTRVFDVKVEGKTLLSNVDLSKNFGHTKGGMEKITTTVTDGTLNIEFVKKINNPIINAIEIVGIGSSPSIVITNPIPNQTNKVGDKLDGNLLFTATGGVGALIYSAYNLPPGISIEDVNGRLYGTIEQSAQANSPYQVTLKVKDSNSPIPNEETNTFTWTIGTTSNSSDILLRINSGGLAVPGTNGSPIWEKNDGNGSFSGNGFTVNNGKSYSATLLYSNKHSSIPSYIDKTTFESIFSRARFGTESSNMVYSIPLASGTYDINLYMGNSTSSSSNEGQRVFDVKVEGKTLLSNVDLSKNFGHTKGGMEKITTTVSDGTLNIEFVRKVNNPLINAIEIVGAGSSPAGDLVGYWKMDDGSGNTLTDHSGYGNNAYKVNSSNWNWVTGKNGLALLLDKSTVEYGAVPHNSTINLTNQLTISAWIRPADLLGRHIISKGGTNGYELLTIGTGKVEFRFNRESNGSTYRLVSNQNYPSDGKTWLHVTATFDGKKSVIYFNGIEDNSKSYSSTTIKTNTSEIQIGARNSKNQWSGALDEIRLYNRALTATEVSKLPNQYQALRIVESDLKFHDLTESNNNATFEKMVDTLVEDSSPGTKLFPNPVEDIINIQIESILDENVQVRIFDMKGINILDTETEMVNGKLRIDLTSKHLKQGSYILFVNSDGYQRVFKFIKK